MCEAKVITKLIKLLEIINSVPPPNKKKQENLDHKEGKLIRGVTTVQLSALKIKKPNIILDILNHLILKLKYLVFDLEATRRENAQLKKQLDDEKKK